MDLPWPRRVELAFLATAALVVLLGLVALLVPHQITYAEGYMLEQAVRLAEGEGLYRDSQPPWVLDNFPPVWPAALAVGVHWFGVSFAWGRALTLAAVAGLLWLLLAFQRRRGDARWLAWGVAALWLLSPFVLRRAVIARMDFPALLLAALGVWCVLEAARRRAPGPGAVPAPDRGRRWTALALACLCFALAAFTRQTMLVAPVAAAAALWSLRLRRPAVAVLGGTGVLVAAGAFTLQGLTDGNFLRQVVLDNTGRYALDKLGRMTWVLLAAHAPLLLFGGWGAWRSLRDGTVEGRVLGVWACAEAVASCTVGKPGAAINHYLPLLYVAALHAAPGLRAAADAARRWKRFAQADATQRGARLALMALAFQAVVLAGPLAFVSAAVLTHQDDEGRLVAVLRAEDAPILSENAGAVLQAGHPVLIEPRLLLERHEAGAWDDDALVRAIEDRNFSLVVMQTFPEYQGGEEGFRLTPAVWAALREHYAPTEQVGRWNLWRPLPA